MSDDCWIKQLIVSIHTPFLQPCMGVASRICFHFNLHISISYRLLNQFMISHQLFSHAYAAYKSCVKYRIYEMRGHEHQHKHVFTSKETPGRGYFYSHFYRYQIHLLGSNISRCAAARTHHTAAFFLISPHWIRVHRGIAALRVHFVLCCLSTPTCCVCSV